MEIETVHRLRKEASETTWNETTTDPGSGVRHPVEETTCGMRERTSDRNNGAIAPDTAASGRGTTPTSRSLWRVKRRGILGNGRGWRGLALRVFYIN